MTLQEVTLALAALKQDREEERKRHEKKTIELDSRDNNLCWTQAMLENGMDMVKINRAMQIVSIYLNGSISLWETDYRIAILQVLDGAALDAAKGFPLLKSKYFGLKDYDRFQHQRCDCDYYMGPRHGDIMFRVSLTEINRNKGPDHFSPEHINAVIYYFRNYLKHEELRRRSYQKNP